MKELKSTSSALKSDEKDHFSRKGPNIFTLNGYTFQLDPDEQELSDELDRLSAAGLLKSTLTPARRKELQQAAANTLEMIRQGKRWMIERPDNSYSAGKHDSSILLKKTKLSDTQRRYIPSQKLAACA